MRRTKGWLTVLGGSNGNRQRLCGFRSSQHVALPVKNPARFDDQAGRVNFAGDGSFRLYLDSARQQK